MKLATFGTHAIALFGVGMFLVFHLPLPWLFGPMFACLIAAFLSMPLQAIKPLNAAMRTILGVAVGASVTFPFLMSFPGLWQTLVFVPIMILLIGAIGVPYFQRLCGYDFPTSYYASMPGGLQDMLVFGAEAGGNLRAISLIHATRVLIIVTALPALLTIFWNVDLTQPPGAPASSIAPVELALMAFCGIAGWRIAKVVGLFGASILGPLILTAGFSLAGLITHRPPAEAIWAAQFFIGITIGVNYRGITLAELRNDVLAGVGFSAILVLLTAGALVVVSAFNLAPQREALLALAPGGQAELVVLSIIVGADVGFVIAHHLFRIFVVILGAPLAARIFNAKPLD
ncbi:MAG: AbrB family transcriptional regulator [Cognatishimia sp.]|uniref:AbrB family transcriptional regulator n=1 Tax=Cognatishimia sp. TaxID=2211648 RepID=UPI004058910B